MSDFESENSCFVKQFGHGIKCIRHMKIRTSMKIQIARTIPKLSSLYSRHTQTSRSRHASDYATTEYDNEDPDRLAAKTLADREDSLIPLAN